MNIGIITGNFPPKTGGIATFSWEFAFHLARHPHVERVIVVVFGENVPPATPQNANSCLEIVYIPQCSILQKGYHLLHKMHRLKECNLFHAMTLFPEGAWMTLWANTVLKKNTFVTIYGTEAISTAGTYKTKLAKRYALTHVTRVISFSHSTEQRTRDFYGLSTEQSTVIYPGISRTSFIGHDEQNIRKQFGFSHDDFLVLTVCRLVERKGVDDLIRAIHLLTEPRIKLLIVGKGEEYGRLQELARALHVEHRVVFAGNVPYEKVGAFYKGSDLFVLPSFFKQDCGDIEGLGIVFLEAQLYGLPVIGTNSGGIPEAIKNGVSGDIVPERSPESIKNRIEALFYDTALYQKYSENAIQFVSTLFSWENCINHHLALYQSVM